MGTTRYTWDVTTDAVLQESDGLGAVQATYTRRPETYGPLLSQYRSGNTSYYHFDALGSTRVLSDDSQSVTDNYIYDAWGIEVEITAGVTNRYRWIGCFGYAYDSILKIYAIRRRLFDPQRGQWTSIDPVHNSDWPYKFGSNSPMLHIDPNGLTPFVNTTCGVARPTSTTAGCCIHEGTSYSGFDAACVCRCAGDSPWDNFVRACLHCAAEQEVESVEAHNACYALADRTYGRGAGTRARLDIGIRCNYCMLVWNSDLPVIYPD